MNTKNTMRPQAIALVGRIDERFSMKQGRPFLDAFPELGKVIVGALLDMQRGDVADQFEMVRADRVTISESGATRYIYVTESRPLNDIEKNIIGVKHGECISLDVLPGMVVVDVDNFGRVRGVEVLDWPSVFNE